MNRIKIDNSYPSAVKSGSWKNPGAKLYDKLLDALDWKGDDPVHANDLTTFPQQYLEEAYLIVGRNIQNSPYGRTPFSRSGCKYPHHVIKNGRLVVHIPGLRAAYARAKQMGEFKGDVKKHLIRHFKEMRIFADSMMESDMRIEENFDMIEAYLTEKFEDDDSFMEASRGKLNQCFRVCVNVEDGHMIRVVFDLKAADVVQVGDHGTQHMHDGIHDKEVIRQIRKEGHGNFSSMSTVIAIYDMDTKKRLQSVRTIGIIGNDGTRFHVPDEYQDERLEHAAGKFTAYPVSVREKIAKEIDLRNKSDVITFTVGEKEQVPSYKSTRAAWSEGDVYYNQYRSARGFEKNGKTNVHIRNAVAQLKKRGDAVRPFAKKTNVAMYDEWLGELMGLVDEQKDETFGQTVGDTRYNDTYKLLERIIRSMERDARRAQRKNTMKESASIYDAFMEGSQGKLNRSFRVCANVENGHMVRIVFDLNPKDIHQIGDHVAQDGRNPMADCEIMKKVRSAGHNNFSSTGTVVAIIDMDTKEQLQTVRTIGVIGNDGTRFQVPEKYRDKRLKDDGTTFSAYPVSIREQIAKETDLSHAPDVTTFTVGEKEQIPSYKATRATWSTTDVYNNQWKKGRGHQANLTDRTGIHIRTAVEQLKKRADAVRSVADEDDVEAFDRFYSRIMKLVEEQKNEAFGQTPGDARYSKLFHTLDGLVSDMEYDAKHSQVEESTEPITEAAKHPIRQRINQFKQKYHYREDVVVNPRTGEEVIAGVINIANQDVILIDGQRNPITLRNPDSIGIRSDFMDIEHDIPMLHLSLNTLTKQRPGNRDAIIMHEFRHWLQKNGTLDREGIMNRASDAGIDLDRIHGDPVEEIDADIYAAQHSKSRNAVIKGTRKSYRDIMKKPSFRRHLDMRYDKVPVDIMSEIEATITNALEEYDIPIDGFMDPKNQALHMIIRNIVDRYSADLGIQLDTNTVLWYLSRKYPKLRAYVYRSDKAGINMSMRETDLPERQKAISHMKGE